MNKLLLIFVAFTFAQTSLGQVSKSYRTESVSFKVGEKLELYYPLDSIKNITLNNWKGKHVLSKISQKQLIAELKNYKFLGHYAHTKPGHLWCMITFLNGSTFYFDSNSESEIIISNVNMGANTFISKKKLNFEHY